MPTSDAENKDIVITWCEQIKPRHIVDVGAGDGTYSRLLRHFGARMTAVEAWGPYITEYGLNDQYKDVIVADARFLNPEIYRAELVIMGDMLEHMKASEAILLIETVKMYAKNIIICIPVLHLPQEAYEGNFFEQHIDHWTYDDMATQLNNGLQSSKQGETLAYFWWQKEQ